MDIPLTLPASAQAQGETCACGEKHILVIEDDPVVRFNVVCFLEDSGFRVSEQERGDAGIEAARTMHPDLVLCDLRMPGLDGMEVLRRLHAEQPDLPVVVISGTGVLGDAVDALRNGASDFVTKPIYDMAVLEHAIKGALEKARLQADNRRYQFELQRANEQLQRHVQQLEQDACAGRKLQQQLMPAAQRLMDGCRCSSYLLPSLHLSGDFLDYFMLDDKRLAFYLADVSGHGVPSAFVTVLLKSLIDRYVDRYREEGDPLVLDPARLLARLNADLLAQRLDKYTTLLFAVIDTRENRLVFSTGGHFPAPMLFDGKCARFIAQRGFPVGLFQAAGYENVSMELPAQYRLALFSDGVLDALPDPTLRDKQNRLLQAVQRSTSDGNTLLSFLGLDAGRSYPDDITLLTVERMS
ncbi:MAG: SpoIIE family protein phosphatase [Gammaproteobacteria bacterium]|jgi:serine phosphatase RsbU (regulator of sigma subunit)